MLRVVAAIVGLIFPLAGLGVALYVSGVEPDRQISYLFAAKYVGVGLALGFGLLVFAFLPHRVLGRYTMFESLCILGLSLPFSLAVYLAITAAWPVKIIWIAIGVVCAACMVSLQNARTKAACASLTTTK